MKRLLAMVCVAEVLTGIALVIAPTIVVKLLIGEDIAGAGVAVGRVTGLALIGLGVSCWPAGAMATVGMLSYSTLVALYLASIGIRHGGGVLLWPVVAAHALISALLAYGLFKPPAE